MTTLFFDSRKGFGKSENFVTYFNPPFELDRGREYEMCLISADIWYSWQNITEKNNKFIVIKGDGNPVENHIPPGAYNIPDINKAIKQEDIILSPNYNTLKSRLELKNGVKVDFRVPDSINKVLGFEKELVSGDGIHESENLVNITDINTIEIHCDLIEGSYVNGESSSLLHAFSPTVLPGELINLTPSPHIYVTLKNYGNISSIRFALKDQDGNFVDMNNERVTVWVHLREKT